MSAVAPAEHRGFFYLGQKVSSCRQRTQPALRRQRRGASCRAGLASLQVLRHFFLSAHHYIFTPLHLLCLFPLTDFLFSSTWCWTFQQSFASQENSFIFWLLCKQGLSSNSSKVLIFQSEWKVQKYPWVIWSVHSRFIGIQCSFLLNHFWRLCSISLVLKFRKFNDKYCRGKDRIECNNEPCFLNFHLLLLPEHDAVCQRGNEAIRTIRSLSTNGLPDSVLMDHKTVAILKLMPPVFFSARKVSCFCLKEKSSI